MTYKDERNQGQDPASFTRATDRDRTNGRLEDKLKETE